MKYTLLALLLGISCNLYGQQEQQISDTEYRFYDSVMNVAGKAIRRSGRTYLDTTFMWYAVLMPVRETTDTMQFLVSFLEYGEDNTVVSAASQPLLLPKNLLPEGNMANFMVPMFISLGEIIKYRIKGYNDETSLQYFKDRGFNVPLLEPEKLGYRVGIMLPISYTTSRHSVMGSKN